MILMRINGIVQPEILIMSLFTHQIWKWNMFWKMLIQWSSVLLDPIDFHYMDKNLLLCSRKKECQKSLEHHEDE